MTPKNATHGKADPHHGFGETNVKPHYQRQFKVFFFFFFKANLVCLDVWYFCAIFTWCKRKAKSRPLFDVSYNCLVGDFQERDRQNPLFVTNSAPSLLAYTKIIHFRKVPSSNSFSCTSKGGKHWNDKFSLDLYPHVKTLISLLLLVSQSNMFWTEEF